MTKLYTRKTRLLIETGSTARYRGKERPIIVEPDRLGEVVTVRLKGTRLRYSLTWRGIFDHAALVTADRQRRERKAARKAA